MKKIILVTGASSGIGLAIATYLARRGYKVYGVSRSVKANPDFEAMKMDVTDEESVNQVIKHIIDTEGRIDGLINNAGIGSAGAFENMAIKDIENSFNTNVYGMVRTCKAVLPHMRHQGSGHIINISTLGSTMGLPFRSVYCGTKSAVDMMTETLRLEVKRFGIQVALVHPGDINTDIIKHRIVSTTSDDEAYGNMFVRTIRQLDEYVKNGLDPQTMGPLIEKILNKKHVRRNYYIGKWSEKAGMWLKKYSPYYIFEKIVMRYYNANE